MATGPDAAFAALLAADELSAGLVLGFLVGPPGLVMPALSRLAEQLHGREILWHDLSAKGPDLLQTVMLAASTRPVCFVVGLERLSEPDLAQIEHRLNLQRDSLAGRALTLVIWVPRDHIADFQRRCADLFHWRTTVLPLDWEDVPGAYLEAPRAEYAQRLRGALGQAGPAAFALIPPLVRLRAEQAPVSVESWAAGQRRGLLLGPAGSGKSTALQWLVSQALDRGQPALLLQARDLGRGNPQTLEVTAESLAPGARLLDGPGALVAVDALDEVEARQRQRLSRWLEHQAERLPGVRLVAASRAGLPEQTLPRWSRATMAPWSQEQVLALVRRVGDERGARAAERLAEALSATPWLRQLTSSPAMLALLMQAYADSGRLPRSRLQLVSTLARTLGLRELRKGAHATSTLSGEAQTRLLARIARDCLERGREDFGPHDVARALEEQEMPQVDAAGVVQDLAERSSLVARQADGSDRFMHLSLLEGLAAIDLVSRGPSAALDLVTAHLIDPAWREVLVMTGAELCQVAADFPARLAGRGAPPELIAAIEAERTN